MKSKQKSVRLENMVTPITYSMQIEPNLSSFTFGGSEVVDIYVNSPTKKIVFHCAELKISSVYVAQAGKKQLGKVSYNNTRETVTFTFFKLLNKGKATLTVDFEGILNDKMRGF